MEKEFSNRIHRNAGGHEVNRGAVTELSFASVGTGRDFAQRHGGVDFFEEAKISKLSRIAC